MNGMKKLDISLALIKLDLDDLLQERKLHCSYIGYQPKRI